jgi:hypothetical protein
VLFAPENSCCFSGNNELSKKGYRIKLLSLLDINSKKKCEESFRTPSMFDPAGFIYRGAQTSLWMLNYNELDMGTPFDFRQRGQPWLC